MGPITGVPLLDWFLGFLDVAGYPMVFGITVLENIFIVGAFTPGETVVVGGAFLSTPQYGSLSFALVWAYAVLGTTIGSNISYFLGRRGGREALVRYGNRFHISEERIAEAEEYFFLHGSKTVFLSRFTVGFKSFVPMIAGVSRMRLPWFEFYTFLGAAVYTTIIMVIGYFVGENFERALSIVSGVGYAGLAVFVALLIGAVVAVRRLRARRAEAHATAAGDEGGAV